MAVDGSRLSAPHRVVHAQETQRPPPALDMASLSAAVRLAPRPPQYLLVRGLYAIAPQLLTKTTRTLQLERGHSFSARRLALDAES
jgi:hypothetical protein